MKRKVLKPNVVRGGIAIPLGANYYYMSGRKHKDGGIDIGNNPRTGLEVEDGEVMHINKNEAKVFSAVPFLNGKSPAQKVMNGENPNNIFKQQEKFKDINNINDDGTKKEFERKKAYFGSSIFGWGSRDYKAPTNEEILESHKKRAIVYKQKQREREREKQRERERERRNKIIKETNNFRVSKKNNEYYAGRRKIISSKEYQENIRKANPLFRHLANINYVEYDSRLYGKIDKFENNNKPINTKINTNKTANKVNNNTNIKVNTTNTNKNIKQISTNKVNNKPANNINTKTNNKEINNTKSSNTKPNNDINKVNNNSKPINTNKPANKVNTNKPVKTNNKTKSTISFANAFSSARKAGKDIFEWNGKKYTNSLAGETNKTKSNNTNIITPNSNLPFGNDIVQNYINQKTLEKENEDVRRNPFLVKMRTGGVYSVTSNGKTNLRMITSTGERTKAVGGTKKKFTEKDKLADIKRSNKYINDINLNGPKSYKDITKQIYGSKYEPYKTNPESIKLKPALPAFLYNGKLDAFAIEMAKRNGNRLIYNKSNKDNNNDKQRNINDIVSDSLGISSNIIGSTISHNVNRKMLDKLKYNKTPINFKATKLKTNININPQLDKMRESLASYERDIDNNTASSRVALARKQRGRINTMLQTNELYGEKENNETELINKDKINQQSINNKNIEQYNNWRNNKVAFENAVAEKKSENDVGLVNSINNAVQDIIGRRELRNNERQTRLALMAANPNVSPRLLRAFGIKGITDEDIENFDKAHRRKING